jgi:hypothetical protein
VTKVTPLLFFSRTGYNGEMEQEILARLKAQEELTAKIYVSVEKTRTYFKWTFYITLAFVVLPLVALALIIPMVLSGLSSAYAGLL